ncbi:hypothetical protein N7478_003722 [Penicillium angulare]|uniref:uncharacterized protein n=1 Tax=Penicillium angulare TaxID=116970 RepID=UPI0025413AB2|nr:uncharacterized protein N7478_003722 [Penicillium angulare]KAJ5288036.1 hypothetical protein N7478_003722 [Penicillium angulare]
MTIASWSRPTSSTLSLDAASKAAKPPPPNKLTKQTTQTNKQTNSLAIADQRVVEQARKRPTQTSYPQRDVISGRVKVKANGS